MRVLVTRPQPDCRRTAERLRAGGHVADEAPVLHCVPTLPARFDLGGVSALVFTSRRAIAVLGGHGQVSAFHHLPVFTVGDATADAARQAGYRDVLSADGDVSALAGLILDRKADLAGGGVLYLAAAERAGDLEGRLASADVRCQTVAIYRMDPAGSLPDEVLETLRGGGYDAVLVYSRRTAEAFRALLDARGVLESLGRTAVYALSRQAGAPLADTMCVHVAPEPNENALLDLALTRC